jgi:hypothetical protein
VCSLAENCKWNFLFSDVFVWSTLLNIYAKYGKIVEDVWEDTISKCSPHAVAYLQDVHTRRYTTKAASHLFDFCQLVAAHV